MSSKPAAAKTSRLTDVAGGDPDRPRLDLATTDLDALVRLDVRPQVQVVLGGEALHAVDVSLHDVGQHDRHGGVHPVDQAVEYSLKPVHAALLELRSGWLNGAGRPLDTEK
jgi:hypothetical protein